MCVAQARAASWKTSWKPQLLILKLFTLVLILLSMQIVPFTRTIYVLTDKLLVKCLHLQALCLQVKLYSDSLFYKMFLMNYKYSATLCTEFSATHSFLVCLNLKASKSFALRFLDFCRYVPCIQTVLYSETDFLTVLSGCGLLLSSAYFIYTKVKDFP